MVTQVIIIRDNDNVITSIGKIIITVIMKITIIIKKPLTILIIEI